jgi:hypothetical protein
MAFGITGMPSHWLDGFPEGIGKTGAAGVLVGGTGIWVGVLVEAGKLVLAGMGTGVGLAANVLQDANTMTRTESDIALPIVIIFPHSVSAPNQQPWAQALASRSHTISGNKTQGIVNAPNTTPILALFFRFSGALPGLPLCNDKNPVIIAIGPAIHKAMGIYTFN